MPLHRVPVPLEHEALRAKLTLENITDPVERWVVRSGDDQLRKRRPG